MFTQAQSWFMDIVRGLIGTIDEIFFTLVKYILVLIFDMANYEMPFSTLKEIYMRMFVLISVFMVFKLTFTFFQYLMNPDRMSDSKTGLPKLFRNTMIMIVLMIIVPLIFTGQLGGKDGKSFIIRLQNAAIPTLTRVLLGTDGTGAGAGQTGAGNGQATSQNTVDTSLELADEITIAVARAFIHISIGAEEKCDQDNSTYVLKKISDIPKEVVRQCHVKGSGWWIWGDDVYVFSYTYLLPAVVAIIMGFILLRMAISVGKRVFKLMILEIIAPIPIMSLINPQALEKGDSPFMAWLHSLISTFLEIFFQLGILYLFIIFIDAVIDGSADKLREAAAAKDAALIARTCFVTVALVISLLFFAGEAPAFLKKALGIKDTGDDMGNIMAAGIGAAVGGAQGFIQGARHGNALEGMIEGSKAGAQNGSKAKSLSDQIAGMHAGGDAAAQRLTGNKNYRTGFLAHAGRAAARRRGLNENNLYRMGQQKKALQQQSTDAGTAVNTATRNVNNARQEVEAASRDLEQFTASYAPGYTGTCEFTDHNGTSYTGSYDMLLSQLTGQKSTAQAGLTTAENAKTAAEQHKADVDAALQKTETDEKTLKGKMEAAGMNTNVQSWARHRGERRNDRVYQARYNATNTGNANRDAINQAAIDTQIARGGFKVANRPNPTSPGDTGYGTGNPPNRI